MSISGEIAIQPVLRNGNDIEENLINDRDPGEPPPDLLKQQKKVLNSIPSTVKRYDCHSCEPPNCSRPTICHDAVQCWKSRVRQSTGMYSCLIIYIETILYKECTLNGTKQLSIQEFIIELLMLNCYFGGIIFNLINPVKNSRNWNIRKIFSSHI